MKQQYTIDESLVEPRWTELGLARLLSDGALVPDTTLQDIADAHQQALAVRDNPPEARRRYAERDALLDALGGTDKCGAWGGCILSKGHNRGRVDIPENHALEGDNDE